MPDEKIKRMMQQLGHALVHSISTSSKVGDLVRRIRGKGYSLYLVLDRKQDATRGGAQIELTARKPRLREPSFRLDGNDVSLLKSMGIDATRSSKRRRSL